LLEKNLNIINALKPKSKYDTYSAWYYLSRNKRAISIIEKNLDKVHWSALSANPNAIHILENNINKIDFNELCQNPNGVQIVDKYIDRILSDDDSGARLLENPYAIHIIEKHFDKFDKYDKFWYLSKNRNAVHLLKKQLKLSDIDLEKDYLGDLLEGEYETNVNGIDWASFISLPNVFDILEPYLEKYAKKYAYKNIDIQKYTNLDYLIHDIHLIQNISMNTQMFCKLDTNAMRKKCQPFAEDLAKYVFNPVRLNRLSELYGIELEDYIEYYE
jgi:hypothetical protein